MSVSVACAQTREETLDFLLRDVEINQEYFDTTAPGTAYDERQASDFSIAEKDCVVIVSAHISGEFKDYNTEGNLQDYNNEPMSVTIDFNKLIFKDATYKDIGSDTVEDGLYGGLEIRIPGDDGAVTGWSLEWNGDVREHRRKHWSENFLLLQFPRAKAPRALNAIKYFFSTYCKGDTRAF